MTGIPPRDLVAAERPKKNESRNERDNDQRLVTRQSSNSRDACLELRDIWETDDPQQVKVSRKRPKLIRG